MQIGVVATLSFVQQVAAQPTAKNPFAHRVDVPELPTDLEWLNTSGPIKLSDLRGKFVIFDFWTYCCINCIHVLPELKKLEEKYANELVVIGVHSAKFETERDSKNIEEAILRYEIEHPVINDSKLRLWNTFGVRSWPTILMLDPEGKAVLMQSGEFTADQLSPIIDKAIAHYDAKKLIDRTPVRFDLLAHRENPSSALRFPGKVLADSDGKRLFIADSNHNRILITSFDGTFIDAIGNGLRGKTDGSFENATFDHPQGMAVRGNRLFIADTENHLIRAVDLAKRTVTTIAGTGIQGRNPWPGFDRGATVAASRRRWRGKPLRTAISSPWDLYIHKDHLYIAMAGPHQIWWMHLNGAWIAPYAGNGREDIVDGPLLPNQPYGLGSASFAQPSGLTSDGKWLYVADSEGSSIRAVPFNPRENVWTVVGTANLPQGRLFHFGDVDGPADVARLQHPLGVAFRDGKIYVADTYNNKIKAVDANTGETVTVAGTGQPGNSDEPAQFDEPAGLSIANHQLFIADTNNHAIRVLDLNNRRLTTLDLKNIPKPKAEKEAISPRQPTRTIAAGTTTVGRKSQVIKLSIVLPIKDDQKLNTGAPVTCEVTDEKGIVLSRPVRKTIDPPNQQIELTIPIEAQEPTIWKVQVDYVYCTTGSEGLCRFESVEWQIDLAFDDLAFDDQAYDVIELK